MALALIARHQIAAHRRYDYFSFHDVDMIPINGQDGNTAGPVYKYVTQPTHLATAAEQYKWEMPCAGYCGGVLNLNLYDAPVAGSNETRS